MDEAGDRAAGHRAAQALSRRGSPRRRPRRACRPVRRPSASRRRSVSASIPISTDPTRYAVYASQDGLGLPNRDYYLLQAPNTTPIATPIATISSRSRQLAGIADAAAKADRIIALETAIAKDPLDARAEPRHRARSTIRWTARKLNALRARSSSGTARWPSSACGKVDTVVVARDERDPGDRQAARQRAARNLEGLARLPLRQRPRATICPRRSTRRSFDFYSKTLRDVQTQRDRWKRGVDLVNNSLGEGGRPDLRPAPLSARKQPPDGRADRQFPRRAARRRSSNSNWMDEATKKEALAKLASFDPRTGHPVKYIDYSTPEGGARRPARQCHARRANSTGTCSLSRLPKPVDRTLWDMTAADQQRLLRSDPEPDHLPGGDPAAALFRSQRRSGRQLRQHRRDHRSRDRPRLRRPGPQVRRHGRAARLVDPGQRQALQRPARRSSVKQYDAYEPIPGVHIKGELTLGENLGDLGGLEIAYAAYRRHVAKHGEPPVIDGLTGDQRFFIAYGYSWQSKQRDGRASRAAADRPALAGQISRQRRRPQHGRLVQGVQRPARRQALPAARTARADLVGS